MSDRFVLHHGDCLEVLAAISDCSIDSVVCDPPYGLSFMGRKWDYDVPSEAIWRECLRVLKPGGHLLAFAGTRTQHRMAVRIEDAGFEIRDMIAWVYGSGFPKSMDVSKAIDKAAGAEREVVGRRTDRAATPKQDIRGGNLMSGKNGGIDCSAITAPATEAAKQWAGWGTALKPAMEPITVARKPLIGTVAANVMQYGTGAINVDGCRVATDPSVDDPRLGGNGSWSSEKMAKNVYEGGYKGEQVGSSPLGRFPANFIHNGSDDVVKLFPNTSSGVMKAGTVRRDQESTSSVAYGVLGGNATNADTYGDSGSAARFFYCAKASKKDRGDQNNHPTVKPTDLMRYLCRLVTPPGGLILDPFMGSGSTGKAAMIEGFRFIGIEREAEYLEIAQARIAHAVGKTNDMLAFE